MAGTLGTIAAGLGVASGARDLFGSGRNRPTATGGAGTYVPTGQGTADQSWQDLMRQLTATQSGAAGQLSPAIMQGFQNLMGLDTGGLTGAASWLQDLLPRMAGTQANLANTINTEASKNFAGQQALQGAGNQLWQTALDPEGDLKKSLQQQVTDASRASTSARGLGMSGVGAGIENKDVSDFLMNWQDRQLGRQATGLQGMSGAYGTGTLLGNLGGRDVTAGSDLMSLVPGYISASGTMPYGLNRQAAGQPIDAANAAGGALNTSVYGPSSTLLNQFLTYMGLGQQGGAQAFGQQQTGLNNLTTALGQLGRSFGGGGGSIFGPGFLGQFNNPIANSNQGSNWSGEADPYGGYSGP